SIQGRWTPSTKWDQSMSFADAPHPGQPSKKTGRSYQGGGPTKGTFPGNNFHSFGGGLRFLGHNNPQPRHTLVKSSQSGDSHTKSNSFMVGGASSGRRHRPCSSSRNHRA